MAFISNQSRWSKFPLILVIVEAFLMIKIYSIDSVVLLIVNDCIVKNVNYSYTKQIATDSHWQDNLFWKYKSFQTHDFPPSRLAKSV